MGLPKPRPALLMRTEGVPRVVRMECAAAERAVEDVMSTWWNMRFSPTLMSALTFQEWQRSKTEGVGWWVDIQNCDFDTPPRQILNH